VPRSMPMIFAMSVFLGRFFDYPKVGRVICRAFKRALPV
jgi:hypothetical protein